MTELYYDGLPEPEAFQAELSRWRHHWKTEPASSRPRTVLTTLPECSVNYYPNIRILMQIFVVLPVSVAECEPSFSTLKRLKTYLRSTMGQERLVGLALMGIHRDIRLSPEELAEQFMQQPKLRITE